MTAWQRFRRAPGARLGLGVMLVLVAVGLGADLLASDLPLACRQRGTLHLLPCLTRPAALVDGVERIDGWQLRTPIPYGPYEQHPGGVTAVLAPPSRSHWLGTDDRGRDVAARLVHGTRAALLVGPFAVALYVLLGLAVGVAATLGRTADFLLGRAVEVGLMFPTLLLLLAIQGVTSSTSLLEVALAIAVTQWPHVARLTRAEALRVAASPHIEAARAVGAGRARILALHLLPLAATPALTTAAFGVGQAVLFETALTFLGFGAPAPTASWGELLAQAQASGLQPWLLVPPTLAIALVVLSCNLVGDGVRAALSSTASA
ncbi:MAG: Dipeptide transport system permease protein DppC [Myxococcales bacterium]|nr:Dipeptide transport system permease protein DppC [Myxococcales bacterium]